jgi:hypothetical protein
MNVASMTAMATSQGFDTGATVAAVKAAGESLIDRILTPAI